MEETEQQDSNEEETYRFGLKSLFGWIIGLGSFIAGISFLAQAELVAGLASLAIPFFSIPLLANKWQKEYGYELSTGMTFLSVCLLLLLVGSMSPTPDSSADDSEVEVQNGQVIVEEKQNSESASNNSGESKQSTDSNNKQIEESRDTEKEPVLEQTAGQVYAEFQNNEIAAKEKYSDGVEVVGTVSDVGEDILSNPYVSLYSTNEFQYVQAMIVDQSQDKLSSLNSGQRLTVKCQSVSTSLGTPFANSCVIVE